MMTPAEKAAIRTVLALGEQYGYGNLIAHLRRAWALRIQQAYPGLSYPEALQQTHAAAYPAAWSVDALAQGDITTATQLVDLSAEERAQLDPPPFPQ